MKILENHENRSEFVQQCNRNSTYLEMKRYCEEAGYELGLCYVTDYGRAHIDIRPANPNAVLPDVYPPRETGEGWRVMTTTYGALDVVDLETFIAAYQCAYDLIMQLNKFDLNKLEHETE